jgi:hypothetical protein
MIGISVPSPAALLWLTHVWTPELQTEFEKLHNMQYPGSPDVWLLMDARTAGSGEIAQRYRRHHIFDERTLFRLPYPRLRGHGLIDHPHFPVLDFFLSHPEYANYWVIEYDVRYTGLWETLFQSFQNIDHDLITAHIRRFAQEPHWYWWDTLQHPSETVVRENYVRSFNVIYRISSRALEFIHHAQLHGWQGYPEVSLPTLLFNGGYKLLDFGGKGEFTLPEFENRFYTSHGFRSGNLCLFGTMRFRPSRTMPGARKNTLYHPVKPGSMAEPPGAKLRILAQWLWDLIYDLVGQVQSKPSHEKNEGTD